MNSHEEVSKINQIKRVFCHKKICRLAKNFMIFPEDVNSSDYFANFVTVCFSK